MDFLSTPVQLGLTVLITGLVVLLCLRIISRTHNSRTKIEKKQTATGHFKPSENQIGDLLDFEGDLVAGYLREISALATQLLDTTRSSDILRTGQNIRDAAHCAQEALKNQSLLSGRKRPNYTPIAVDFHGMIKSISSDWKTKLESPDITFTSHLDNDVPEFLFVDSDVTRRILDTLLSNSQSMTHKGRVHLHVTASNQTNNNWKINLIVADTGRGIPQTFKDDFRSDQSGIEYTDQEQLNLLAVRELIQVVNGDIKVNSVEGRGTEISLGFTARAGEALPQHDETQQAAQDIKHDGPMSGKRVLIIEDDVSSQRVLQTFLVPEGCEIDCINDGDQALGALSKKAYDLILMDVRMDGLDGIQTTQAIRNSGEAFSHVPIIAITADINPDTNAKCMMAGADLFLNKPIGSKALFDGIRFVMDLGTDTGQEKPQTIKLANVG